MRALAVMVVLTSAACTQAAQAPRVPPSSDGSAPAEAPAVSAPASPSPVADDGTYLQQIDPLGGNWQVGRIGDRGLSRFGAWVTFSDGGFLNHGAGCGGGHPAFYNLDGSRITVTRREPVRIGKCAGTPELASGSDAVRSAAGESERRLAEFIDQVSSWRRQDGTLVLTARDGTVATLTRPPEPHLDIAGRWMIESIGGQPLVTERGPATVTIGMGSIGAYADCNSMGAPFTVPAPGKITVSGPIVSTAIGCAAEDLAEDELMTRAMAGATGYRLEGERLVISGSPGMVLRRPPPPNRRLAGEYESCGNTLLGAFHEGPVTLSIDQRTIRDNASCTATYRADGPYLTLALPETPACGDTAPPYSPGEPAAIGGEISTLSVARPDAFGFNSTGQLILRTNRGLLTMCRKGEPKPFGSG